MQVSEVRMGDNPNPKGLHTKRSGGILHQKDYKI